MADTRDCAISELPDGIPQADGTTWRRACDQMIANVLRDVAELPDRTSPAGQPDMMLVSADELRAILSSRLGLE